MTSTSRTARARARNADDESPAIALLNAIWWIGVAKCPSRKMLSRRTGRCLSGRTASNGRNRDKTGRGFRANEADKMTPARPGGLDAAIEIAMGPENDSANRT